MVEAVSEFGAAAPRLDAVQPNHLLSSDNVLNLFSVSHGHWTQSCNGTVRRNVEATPFGLFVRLVPMHQNCRIFDTCSDNFPKIPSLVQSPF